MDQFHKNSSQVPSREYNVSTKMNYAKKNKNSQFHVNVVMYPRSDRKKKLNE